MLRADALTEVHPPTLEEEAVRDLSRCREDAREDLLRARHRLGKMLLRRGLVHSGRAWTEMHRRWLRCLSFEHEADRAVFDDYLRAIEHLEERLRGLEEKLVALSEKEPYREPVGWLRCFRGIDTVTAMTLVAELHDFRRFESPRALMAFLGLVPSENSTGEKHRRGAITRAGNTPRTACADRSLLALPASARSQQAAPQAARGAARLGHRRGGPSTASAPQEILEAGVAREVAPTKR